MTIGNRYNYVLSYEINDVTQKFEFTCTYGGLTAEDAVYNSLNQQSNLIREQIAIDSETLEQTILTNEKLDSLNDNIIDDTITSSGSDLPSIDVSDPTETGIDNIFDSIYDAFCTGEPENIVFPIPFTDKNIALSPYYVKDMLTNNGASWVYTLIQAFWAYLIGRYIVKDISSKITKIKSGDIENIENNNIKEEML